MLEEIRILRSGKEEAEKRLEQVEAENRALVNRVRVLEEIEAKYFRGQSKENTGSFSTRKTSEAPLISDRNAKPSILKSQLVHYDPQIPIL